MSFWVYGRDSETGQPTEPFLSDAASEGAARAEATAQGMIVESVSPFDEQESAESPTSIAAIALGPPTTASSIKRCRKCGYGISQSAKCCPKCGTPIESYPDPAGFWIRVVAQLIDGLVMVLPVGFLGFAALAAKSLPLALIVSIPGFIYKPFMESWYGATLGKMACGLQVVNDNGEKLTIGAAYIRFLPFLLAQVTSLLGMLWLFSVPEFQYVLGFFEITRLMDQSPFDGLDTLTSFIVLGDCITAAFSQRKRAVHDMMAGSYCIRHTG